MLSTPNSQAVEFSIDEDSMTARQRRQSETMGPDWVVAIAMGDVGWLPHTENVLAAYGALLDPASIGSARWQSSSRLEFSQRTRPREFMRSDPPEVVYEVALQGDGSDLGWSLNGVGRIDCIGP